MLSFLEASEDLGLGLKLEPFLGKSFETLCGRFTVVGEWCEELLDCAKGGFRLEVDWYSGRLKP